MEVLFGLAFWGMIWIIWDLIKAANEPTMTSENWKNIERFDAFNLSAKDFQKKLKGK